MGEFPFESFAGGVTLVFLLVSWFEVVDDELRK